MEGAAWLMWRSFCDEREVRSQLGQGCGGYPWSVGTRPVFFNDLTVMSLEHYKNTSYRQPKKKQDGEQIIRLVIFYNLSPSIWIKMAINHPNMNYQPARLDTLPSVAI